ncbi:mannose-6-phosphate isomerase, class I [Streptosporangium sp. NBC_01639]|uniref:mannose-6-phosphate isomerase, class I n=1 Tax=Streptosporangium sp. NBC_01639 TaxID=2975948 RepID=UPI003868127C|nr:mannose-6-phosphate isomerase, class I [Streptosporangium sp. NBC_01639]
MNTLVNTIKEYDWGSPTAIPALTGRTPTGRPQAEMWLGAHPAGPSALIRSGVRRTLADVITDDADAELGPAVKERFGTRLPYLLKVIAVARPLSLQVHPSEEQARSGFSSGDANYVDSHAKPELICALTPFSALAGFRHPSTAADLLEALKVEPLTELVGILRTTDHRNALLQVLRQLTTWPLEARPDLVAAVGGAAAALNGTEFGLVENLVTVHPADPMVLAPLLLEHHELAPGEGMFLGAGVIHCYLNGLGVELMGASDNVLRAGLTSKTVDPAGLLAIVDPLRHPAKMLAPDGVYAAPVPEFRLRRTDVGETLSLPAGLPRIVLCISGTAIVSTPSPHVIRAGESLFVPAAEPLDVTADGTVFAAEPGL